MSGVPNRVFAQRPAPVPVRRAAVQLQRCGGVQCPPGTCDHQDDLTQRSAAGASGPLVAPAAVAKVVATPGQPLDAAALTDMGERFGHDFSRVRVHTDAAADASARAVHAHAYTLGRHVVMAHGRYQPHTPSGRRLLAHELVHTMQQPDAPAEGGWAISSPADPAELEAEHLAAATGPAGSATSVPARLQRAPNLSVMDENFIGPPTLSQRRAAASCSIGCCDTPLGTLHAMPLFEHASRGAIVPTGSAAATGIGAMIHFIATKSPQVPAQCKCDDYRIIQVVDTTDPAPGRGGNRYVDNAGTNTPFYSDVYLGGRGEHPVPAGYPDAGKRIETTESIYDRPYRSTAGLPARPLRWNAESCVACVKNAGADRVLGCVTYGFTRNYDAANRSFDPVVPVGPSCLAGPSAAFISTLRGDRTTSSYDFETAPDPRLCNVGDFPVPGGDTRLA